MPVDPPALISFVLVTTFTPGPNNISSASMGVLYGYRQTVPYLFGITAGFWVVMLVCAFLSRTLLIVLPSVEHCLRWAGAVYILWLALGTLRANYASEEQRVSTAAFSKGFALQLLNPKVAVYGLTLYSGFLSDLAGRFGLLTLFAAAFALTAFAATSTWALCGAAIRKRLQNTIFRTGVNGLLALLLVYTAIALTGIMD